MLNEPFRFEVAQGEVVGAVVGDFPSEAEVGVKVQKVEMDREMMMLSRHGAVPSLGRLLVQAS